MEPGELKIITAEEHLPYERPPLSKTFLAGEEETIEELLINEPEWYKEHGIDIRRNTRIVEADLRNRHLVAESGERIPFTKMIAATGANPIKFDFASAVSHEDDIYYLRSGEDSKRLRSRAQEVETVAVIGGGFIGMETAATLAEKGLKVSLIYRENRLMEPFFTPEMSTFFENRYKANGVDLWSGKNVRAFGGDDKLAYIKLTTHEEIPADISIVGIGVEPNVDMFENTGLAIQNGIVVNKYLESNMTGIYAAGDVANYYDLLFDKRRRVEHWQMAIDHARHIAQDIFSTKRRRRHFITVPYFYSKVFDLKYEFWGDPTGAEQIIQRGDVRQGNFSVLWLRFGRLIGTFLMNATERERELLPTLIRERRQLPSFVFEDESRSLEELAEQFTY